MKPNSIASADENTEENSEENSIDNEDYDDLDNNDNDEDTYDRISNNSSHTLENYKSLQSSQPQKYNNQSSSLSSNFKRKTKLKFDRKRKCRTTFTKNQLSALECEFLKSNFVSNDKIDVIIEQTGLDSRIIKNWFKNKRSRVLADSKTVNTTSPSKISTAGLNTESLVSNSSEKTELLANPADATPNNFHDFSHYANAKDAINLDFSVNLNVAINEVSVPKMDPSPNNLNKKSNLNGLLNVVHSISSNSIANLSSIASNDENKHPQAMHTTKSAVNTNTNKVTGEKKSKKRLAKKNKSTSSTRKTDENDLRSMLTCVNCSNMPKILCKCNISKLALKKLYKNYGDFITEPTSFEISLQPLATVLSNSCQVTKKFKSFQVNQLQQTCQLDNTSSSASGYHHYQHHKAVNYIVSYERYVLYESIESNTEKILEVL